MTRLGFVFAALIVSQLVYGASVTKTVGTSDPNFDYPTIAAAFAAINAGTIFDGNGDIADSVSIVLMDSMYNEEELRLSPSTGYPRYVSVTPWQNQGTTNSTVNIYQVLGSGVGLTVDSVAYFAMKHVTLTLDSSSPWNTGASIHRNNFQVLLVNRSTRLDSCDFDFYAAPVGIRIQDDSGGT